MMEHSQVRCAILLSFIPLKVRRMKSLALLWATAGPDCRSLKLYWVSAKALTLPISHHGSSQLSLPSGFIPSPERINTQSLCSLYTWAFPLLKSRPRSTSIPSFLACLLCIITNTSSSVISRYCVSAGQREVAFLTESWEFIVVSDGHLVILSSGASAQIIVIFVALDQLPEHWITAEWYHQAVICQISLPLLHPMNEDGHPEVW